MTTESPSEMKQSASIEFFTEIEYPSEAEIQSQCRQILDAALPPALSLGEKLRWIYWEPGLRVIFYQCGAAWLTTGMVYLLITAACLLQRHAKQQIFYSLLCCPLLYLIFSLAVFYSEEQTMVIELKQTLRHSFTRLASLRMFYSSIALVFSDLLLLGILQGCPALRSCSPRALWSTGAAGISSMFLFGLLSLYLYYRLGSYRYLGVLLAIWLLICTGILSLEEQVCLSLFQNIPLPVHLGAAFCSMTAFAGYAARTPCRRKSQGPC